MSALIWHSYLLTPHFFGIFGALSIGTVSLLTSFQRREKRRSAELRVTQRIIDETAHEQWVLLAEMSKSLWSTLDLNETQRRLATLAVPSLADICVVDLIEENCSVRRTRYARWEGAAWATLPIDSVDPILETMRSGQVKIFESITEPLRQTLKGLETTASGKPGRLPTTVMTVPMLGRPTGESSEATTIIGSITFASARPGRRYSSNDAKLGQLLAVRGAVAIDSARLYRGAQLAVRAREQMLAIVSHELKNPLTAIQLQMQLLVKNDPESPHIAAIQSVNFNARQMRRMVNDLLDLDKLDNGRLQMQTEAILADRLVADSVTMLEVLAREKGIRLCVELPESNFPARADRLRISQVISNLVGNAIKFTPEQGQVRLKLDYLEGFAQFAVIDAGPGIAPQALTRVFDRYWQDGKTAHLGSGLGLTVAKGIVELHGGRIAIESEPGRGTKVSFMIPLTQAEPQRPA